MKITIYQKVNNGRTLANTYDFDLGEFGRFSKEFLHYLREGAPTNGVYRQVMTKNPNGGKQITELILRFAEIANIEA